MPGSATFSPYSPPLDGAASVFVVSRYDRESGESTVLPNIKCLSIHYVEGPTPPTAQFEYVLDDTEMDSPFPSQIEDLWPMTASGPYVVQPDDELVVVEVRERQQPYLVFHGFCGIPQVTSDPNGQRITFAASGVAVRLWDTVVEGATYRPSSDPEDGDPFETDLPSWFNPQGKPNCTPDDHDVDDGEDAFRALEREAVAAALAQGRGVVALGGGAPMQETVRELLAGHPVVFLDVSIADAARRIGFDTARPLLAVNPRASWNALMRVRRPVYEALATVRVDTAGRTPQDVAAEAAQALGLAPATDATPDGAGA